MKASFKTSFGFLYEILRQNIKAHSLQSNASAKDNKIKQQNISKLQLTLKEDIKFLLYY